MNINDKAYEYYESLSKFLQNEKFYNFDLVDYNGDYPMGINKISIEVEGDWKHDHWRFKDLLNDWIAENNINLYKLDYYEVGESDSDYYTADYEIYIAPDQDSVNKLNDMSKLFRESVSDSKLGKHLLNVDTFLSEGEKLASKLGLPTDRWAKETRKNYVTEVFNTCVRELKPIAHTNSEGKKVVYRDDNKNSYYFEDKYFSSALHGNLAPWYANEIKIPTNAPDSWQKEIKDKIKDMFIKTYPRKIDESLEDTASYKLRIYKKNGPNKGNLDSEEYFKTKSEAVKRYRELFRKEDLSFNPTVWEKDGKTDSQAGKGWRRLSNSELVESKIKENKSLTEATMRDSIPEPYSKYYEIDIEGEKDFPDMLGDKIDGYGCKILHYLIAKPEFEDILDEPQAFLVDDPDYPVVITAGRRMYPVELPEEKINESLNKRDIQIYLNAINEAEDIDDLKDIIHEIFFYDKALFVKLRNFPKDKSFEELKNQKIKTLQGLL